MLRLRDTTIETGTELEILEDDENSPALTGGVVRIYDEDGDLAGELRDSPDKPLRFPLPKLAPAVYTVEASFGEDDRLFSDTIMVAAEGFSNSLAAFHLAVDLRREARNLSLEPKRSALIKAAESFRRLGLPEMADATEREAQLIRPFEPPILIPRSPASAPRSSNGGTFVPSGVNVNRDWLLIDAAEKVLGRVATEAARHLMGKHKTTFTPYLDMGDHVIVINAAKVRLTGKKEGQKVYRYHSGYPGGLREVTARNLRDTRPSDLVEEAVAGMLPKNKLGKQMYRKLKVYPTDRHPHQAQMPKAWQFDLGENYVTAPVTSSSKLLGRSS